MTTEELLKKRFKVTLDYPNSIYTVGQILQQHGQEYFNTEFFEKYPYIFKELRWDEEIEKEDMPEYVKHLNGTCYKIDRWKYSTAFQVWFDEDHISLWSNALNPSTKEEYESYINQKQQ